MRLLMIGCFLAFFSPAVPSEKIDSLLHELERHPESDKVRASILNQIGIEYWMVNPVESIIYGQQAKHLAETLNDTLNLAFSSRVIGVGFWARGILDMALKNLYASEQLYSQLKDTLGMANCIMNIGVVYEEQENHHRALEYYVEALGLFRARKEERRIATTFNKMGTAFTGLRNLSEAERYLEMALKIHERIGYSYGISESFSRFGLLYNAKNQPAKARDFFERSIEISEANNDQEGLAKSYKNIASLYRKTGDIEKAEQYLLKASGIARSIGSMKHLKEIYMSLKQVYQIKGLYDKALLYTDKFLALQDSIYNEETIRNIRNYEAQLLTVEKERLLHEKEQEIELLEQKARFEFIVRIGFIALLFMLLVIGYLLYSRQKIRARRKQEESEQRTRELDRELQMKNKELTSYTINFVQKNKLFEDLREVLVSLKRNSKLDAEVKQRFKELDRIINNQLQVDKDWEDFKLRFQNLHQNFFDQLTERNPSLTNHELRLSALIRLNFSMKEIGNILGISAESVKTARYRLKKKLNLPSEKTLNDYMKEIGN